LFKAMPIKRLRLALASAAVALLTAACIGFPADPTWGTMMLVGSPPRIMFAFNDRIVQVNPVDGSLVELRDSEGRVRLDEQGNPRVWEVRSAGANGPATFYTAPIIVDEDTLLVAAFDRRMYQVDWPAARILNPDGIALAGHIVANPLATENMLYVPFSEGDLVALRRPGFSEVWTLDTPRGIWSEPVLVDGTLYVASLDHHLYALDAETGAERWRLDLRGALASKPVYYEGHLYIGSFGRRFFKIAPTGQIVAEYETRGWVWGSPALVDGVLYGADLDGYVYALRDQGTRFTPLWEPRQVATGAIRATPVVANNTLIIGSRDRMMYWLSRITGEELVRRQMVGEVLGDLLLLEPSETLNIREPMVVVSTMTQEELLVAFTVETGERLWVYRR